MSTKPNSAQQQARPEFTAQQQLALVEEYEKLFIMPAWQDLMTDIQRNDEAISAGLLASDITVEKLNFARGRHQVYRDLLGLQGAIEQARSQIEQLVETERTLNEANVL